MPKTKKTTIDKLVDTVKESAAKVLDTPEDDLELDASASTEIDDSPDLDSPELVTSADLDAKFSAFEASMVTVMSDLLKKQTDVHHDFMGQGQSIPCQELGSDQRGIEPVAANDIVPQAKLEEFMNQILTIYVHPSNNKEDNPVLVPSVNGVTQPIIRGQASKVRRKFVEALARNRHTGYEQITPDVTKPHKYVMSPCMVVKDPFTVQHDPHPNGVAWIQNILAEA